MADPRPLHIGIDGRELVGHATGVGRYVSSVLRAWTRTTSRHRFTVFLPTSPTPDLERLGPGIGWQVEPAAAAGTWWEQVRLPAAARRSGVDVFFAAGYTGPLRLACPMVLAIYDVSYFAHPEWFGRREGLRRRWLTRASARRAHSVVTISEFSAAEIERYVGVPRDRQILAVPGAPDVVATPVGRRPPVVLFVGSLFNRRRIPDLIAAFASTTRQVPDARLVLVGDNRTERPRIDPVEIARESGVADRVEWRAYVSDAELARLYATARVFVFLSDYEGFGMTPLEAIAAGVPAVLLDTAVTREMYGDAADLVPPSRDAIARSLTRLLSDPSAHAALLARGRGRLATFSWDRSAALILRALEAAAPPA